ncbi:histone chaperone ASF1 [Nematocida major]|uniref:histone chaperone ASF1 n=1 Tax=Nematocida major TaxID=1912982 RepID=UPI002007E9FE|nr:histone chaperone ASF1 [Nematocida major]KAH9386345.1 histone chaperone ASF1 [Nematocida major]
MIEVCFIDIFANGGSAADVFKKKMMPTVRVSSTEANASLKVCVVYSVSSADTDYDQVLCSEVVEGIDAGIAEFDLETEIPDLEKIPREHLIGLGSILFLFSTKDGQQFARVGYFVKVDYPGIHIIEEPRSSLENEAVFELEGLDCTGSSEENESQERAAKKKLEGAEGEKDQEDDVSIEAEEAEEGNEEGEIKTEGMHDGVLFVTEKNFMKMELDASKIEGTVLCPPLVTVFTEAWSDAQDEEEEEENSSSE